MKPVLLLLAVVWAGPAMVGAAAPAQKAAPGETPVTMSPFEVQAMSVDFHRWIKVGSPNFIVYTDATLAEASTALRELEMLHAAGQRFFGRRSLKLCPVTVILPTASSDWRKLESKGNVEWKSVVTQEAEEIAELIVVQYDWQDRGLSIMHAAQASGEEARLNLHGPFWFDRGLHSLMETAEFDKDTVGLGRANPRALQLEHGGWLPWGRFFEVDQGSREFVKADRVKQYTAQATIFMHFLFTNADRAWITRMTAWLDYLNAGHAPTEEGFKEIFTQDWKAWQRTMELYMQEGRYRIYTVKVPPEAVRFEVTKFEMPLREMRDLFVLGQILVQNVPASEVSLDAVVEKGLKTDALRELLVAACIKWRRHDAALANLRQLIAAGSTNPRVYTQAASIRTGGAAQRITLDSRLGHEVAEVRAWCRRALELEPYFIDANEALAWAEALAPVVDQQGIGTIEAIYRRTKGVLPTDDVVMALAVALWRVGDTATARELCAKLKDEALGTKQSRELARRLFERINAATANAEAGAVPR